jgi:hypothetical protein
VLDELPSLELSASAVALALVARVIVLARRRRGLMHGRARVESARARDLIGLAILVGALVYAIRSGRASTWFLVAVGVAVAAQLLGFYLRAAAREPAGDAQAMADERQREDAEADEEAPLDEGVCPVCGHAEVIELVDAERLLGGLNQLTPVTAFVCPACGALSGDVDNPALIPLGPQHGTALRKARGNEDQEALEEPAEHQG